MVGETENKSMKRQWVGSQFGRSQKRRGVGTIRKSRRWEEADVQDRRRGTEAQAQGSEAKRRAAEVTLDELLLLRKWEAGYLLRTVPVDVRLENCRSDGADGQIKCDYCRGSGLH